jgi:hypothetical protein
MSQQLISLQFDEQSFISYQELLIALGMRRKGGLLRTAVEAWDAAGSPLELLTRRNFRVDSSPDRIVTVAIDRRLFERVREVAARTGSQRSDVLRCALRWFFNQRGLEIAFGPLVSGGGRGGSHPLTTSDTDAEGGAGNDALSGPFALFTPSTQQGVKAFRASHRPSFGAERSDFEKLVGGIERLVKDTIELHGDIPKHDGYRSTGFAAIDALYAANAQYKSVENVKAEISPMLDRWFGDGPAYPSFSIQSLLELYRWAENNEEGLSSPEFLAQHFFRNRSRIGGRLKADALRDFCETLSVAHHRIPGLPSPLNTIEDFDLLWSLPNADRYGDSIVSLLRQIRGIGPATPRYFLLLTGAPFIKPDVMVQRFVSDVLGRNVLIEELAPLLEPAILYVIRSHNYPYTVARIDHLIWRFASRRPLTDN